MEAAVIKQKVDEYAKWDNLMQDCKKQIETLKAEFQKLGTEALKDKKVKQVEFWGTGTAKVVVTESETLKIAFRSLLKDALGEVLNDFEKEKNDYDYSSPFKQILTSIFQGSYIDQRFNKVLAQIPVDDKTRETLAKKLKGKWEKDVAALMNIGKLSKKDAEYYAYQVTESKEYEKIIGLLKAAGYEPGTDKYFEALETIKAAVIVEDSIKIGIETEKDS